MPLGQACSAHRCPLVGFKGAASGQERERMKERKRQGENGKLEKGRQTERDEKEVDVVRGERKGGLASPLKNPRSATTSVGLIQFYFFTFCYLLCNFIKLICTLSSRLQYGILTG